MSIDVPFEDGKIGVGMRKPSNEMTYPYSKLFPPSICILEL
jgi:hypothetical protein